MNYLGQLIKRRSEDDLRRDVDAGLDGLYDLSARIERGERAMDFIFSRLAEQGIITGEEAKEYDHTS